MGTHAHMMPVLISTALHMEENEAYQEKSVSSRWLDLVRISDCVGEVCT